MATIAQLDEAFLRVLERHKVGSPMDETLKWTNLKRHEIADLLQDEGIAVSVTVVDQLLEKHHFRKRKAVKTLATGASEQRLGYPLKQVGSNQLVLFTPSTGFC